MNFIDSKVEKYAEEHSQQPSNNAKEILEWTVKNSDEAGMLSGGYQGTMLKLLVRVVKARRVLEIGMYTGFSALTMAEELPKSGELITLDVEEDSEAIARKFFGKSPHGKKIKIIIGEALETIPKLNGPFDLVYIDADKENYIQYYEMVVPLLKTGGLIVADNVLWSSSVLDPQSESAHALNDFNQHVAKDSRVMNIILTMRDGLMIALKK